MVYTASDEEENEDVPFERSDDVSDLRTEFVASGAAARRANRRALCQRFGISAPTGYTDGWGATPRFLYMFGT